MALSQSALSELLEAFRTGDGVDLIRESVRTVLQELVEFEAAGVIGAERYERTEDRVSERNGTRAKLLARKAGDVELRIPKLRKGSFLPEDPRAPPTDRPGAVRGGDGGLRARRLDPQGGRSRGRAGRRFGDQQVRGVPDL
jgi:hypothetical protein